MEEILASTPYGNVRAFHSHLINREVMWSVHKWLEDNYNFRGTVSSWPDENGTFHYQMEGNDYGGNGFQGFLNQHVVFIPGVSVNSYDHHTYQDVIFVSSI